MHVFRHFATITKHRHAVMRNCFKVGLVKRGLLHDLSKYSPSEFIPGAKFYQGNRSPQTREREVLGYSAAWLHHKGRNRHHFEYWSEVNARGERIFIEMPDCYLAEMICDRVAASKIYLKDRYTDDAPLDYFLHNTDLNGMNEVTREKLGYYLKLLAEKGEKVMFKELKNYLKENKKSKKHQKKQNEKGA